MRAASCFAAVLGLLLLATSLPGTLALAQDDPPDAAARPAADESVNLKDFRPRYPAPLGLASVPRGLFCLDLHERNQNRRALVTGSLYRELCRQALLIAARDELGMATRDRVLREEFPTSDTPTDWPLSLVMQVSPEHVATISVIRYTADGVTLLWEQEFTLDRDAPYESLTTIAGRLSREEFRELLLANGCEVFRAPQSAPDEPIDADTSALLERLNDISQYAAIRALHHAVATSGESPQRLAALSRAYANLSILTNAYCAAMYKAFSARSLLYAERLAAKYPDSPHAVWTRAYALCLAGLPEAALQCLDEGAVVTAVAEPPHWLPAVTAYCRGDIDEHQRLAAENPNDSLAPFLFWWSARYRTDEMLRFQAIAELLQREPDCVRAMYDVPLSDSLGLKASARLTLDRITDLTVRRIDGIPDLPDDVREQVAASRLASGPEFAGAVAALKRAGAPAVDTAEPSLDLLGQMLREAAFVAAWQVLDYEQNALAIDVRGRVRDLSPWIAGHPYAAALPARVSGGSAWMQSGAALLKSMRKEEMEGWTSYVLQHFFNADYRHANGLKTADTSHYDQIAPDLFDQILNSPSAREQQRLVGNLRHVAARLPSTIEARLRWDSASLAEELPQLESRFADDASMMQLLAGVYTGRGETEAGERCARRWIEISPSYNAWNYLAEIRKFRGDLPGWIDACEQALQQPVLGLEHATTRSALAEYFLGQNDPQRALPYAEDAAGTGAAWAMLRAAEVHERLGNLDQAARYQQYTAERYSGNALNWFLWCLRTGGGDLDEAMEFAEQTLDQWGSELSDDNHVRAAMLEMARDDWDAAFDRLLPIGRRSRDPFYVWFAAMLADVAGAADERSELLQRVSSLKDSGDGFALVGTEALAAYLDRQSNEFPDGPLDVAFLDREIARLPPYGMTNLWLFLSQMLKLRGQEAESREYLRLAAASPHPEMWTQFLAAHLLRVEGEEVSRRKYEFVPRAELINAGQARLLQRDEPVALVRMSDEHHVLFSHYAGGVFDWQVTEERAHSWCAAKGHLVDYSIDGARALIVDQATQSCEIWTRDADQPAHAWRATGAVLRAARFIPDDPDRVVYLEMRHNSDTIPGSSLHLRKLSTGADEWRVELGNRVLGGLWADGLDGAVLVAGFERLAGWLAEYRLSDGALVREISVPRHTIDRLVVSADGRRGATLSRFGEICVWDLAQLEIVQRFWSYGSTLISVSRDGRLLATSGTPVVRVYDLQAGALLAEITDHPQAVSQAVFSPSGARLATGASDMTVRVYELAKLEALRPRDAAPPFEFVNSLGMTLEPIPAGEFLMGERDGFTPAPGYQNSGVENERPRHPVTITRPCYLSQFETTVGAFRKFVEATGYVTDAERDGGGWHLEPPETNYINRSDFTWRNPGFEQDDSHPVLQVSWNDASRFCEWLSETEGRRYRLPTEAEWEYACRAGSSMSYSRSNTPWQSTTGQGNIADMAIRDLYNFYPVAAGWDDGFAFSAPVGQYWPNAWGLYDMHGNAQEWCSDWWQPDYDADSPVVDPQGPAAGDKRVLRDGSFLAHADDSRSAHRGAHEPNGRHSALGFRIVLEIEPAP